MNQCLDLQTQTHRHITRQTVSMLLCLDLQTRDVSPEAKILASAWVS